MQLFCPTCGHRNEYSGVKPKFCGDCGKSMDSSLAFKRVETQTQSRESASRSSHSDGDFEGPIGFDGEIEIQTANGIVRTNGGRQSDRRSRAHTSVAFPTIGTVQQNGGSFERGERGPEAGEMRDKAVGSMLAEAQRNLANRPAPVVKPARKSRKAKK